MSGFSILEGQLRCVSYSTNTYDFSFNELKDDNINLSDVEIKLVAGILILMISHDKNDK